MVNHQQSKERRGASDGDVREEIRRAIHRCGYAALLEVHCRLEDGVAELVGNVPSFYLKQIAQEAAQRVRGVRRVDNRLAVRRDGSAETE